jgi:phosphohistidine phosphatase
LHRLLVLRHGKSDWDEQVSDFDRPLAKRGEKAAHKVARMLDEMDLLPDRLISSPAVRALSTAELIEEEVGDLDLTEEPELYGADLKGLLNVVHGLTEDLESVMLVGHNPGLEELVDYLGGIGGTVLKTCSLAVLETRQTWAELQQGSMTLDEIYHQSKDEDS